MTIASKFHVIIPARYQSTRLPGKLLMDLGGQTVIERVYQQALKANPHSLMIATDHPDIHQVSSALGASVMMTDLNHTTGTDRLAEVVAKGDYLSDDIIVNVQGDEPFIDPKLITQVAESLRNTDAPMATLCWPIDDVETLLNPNVVKVVRDSSNHALYFSRQAIPANRDAPHALNHVFRHIGLYAYRAEFLLKLVQIPPCELEMIEALEQLRVLWSGYKIKVDIACVKPLQDINTLDDLDRARGLVNV